MPESVLLLLIDAEILFKVEYDNITQSPLCFPILEYTSAKVLPWLWSGIEPEISKFPVCVSRFGWNPGRSGFGRWTRPGTRFRSWARTRFGSWARFRSWTRTGFGSWARFRSWTRTGFWGWAGARFRSWTMYRRGTG